MRIVIVGAGICGLSAGRLLKQHGHEVVLVDKGRGVGGRMATRRLDGATFDHGAQFFTVRTPAFRTLVEEHATAVTVWGDGFVDGQGRLPSELRYPRYRGSLGMTSFPKALAAGLDCRVATTVTKVVRAADTWQVVLGQGSPLAADAVFLTCPVPQALALLASEVLPPSWQQQLQSMRYEPAFALLLTVSEPQLLPAPGAFRPESDVLAFIADNQQKGISALPALTLHSTGEFARRYFGSSAAVVSDAMLAAAAPWQRGHVVAQTLHRWRYATPVAASGSLFAQHDGLFIAGDAFAGGRVEGAATSGMAAAAACSGSAFRAP